MKRATRILLVDDEKVLRDLIRNLLEKPDLFILEASDGENAISLLLTEPFDLLVVDKNLQGITGLDVVRCAQSVNPNMAIVLIVGNESPDSLEMNKAVGIDEYISKPFGLEDFYQKIKTLLDKKSIPNRMKNRETHPSKRKVLVCEPFESSKQILVEGLKKLGHQPVVVENLPDILEMLRLQQVDSIICDLVFLLCDDAVVCFLRSALFSAQQVKFIAIVDKKYSEIHLKRFDKKIHFLYRPLDNPKQVVQELEPILGRG